MMTIRSISSAHLKKATVMVLVLLVCLAMLALHRIRGTEINNLPRALKNYPTFDTKNSTLRLVASQDDSPYLIPKDEILQTLSDEDLLRIYWKYIHTIQILCKTQIRVGSLDDGGKEMCVDPSYLPSSPCIVYSFGSNFQFDFDLPMHDFYGCEVFTYDPSMNIKGKTLPSQLKFELRGLAGRDYVNEFKWKMSTLETIMRDNGHLNKTIDILKIDVEGGEWDALPPFINSGLHKNVKQILIETHVGKMNTKRVATNWGGATMKETLRVLRLLYEGGFRIFMREHNLSAKYNLVVPPNNIITSVNEISLVNARFY